MSINLPISRISDLRSVTVATLKLVRIVEQLLVLYSDNSFFLLLLAAAAAFPSHDVLYINFTSPVSRSGNDYNDKNTNEYKEFRHVLSFALPWRSVSWHLQIFNNHLTESGRGHLGDRTVHIC
jgi:hypothetical protein